MPELRPQLSAAMTSLQSPIVDKDGKPTLGFHRMLERMVAMIGNDEPFMLTVNQESSRTELDEIKAELASLRAAVDDGANGLQGAREEAQTQLQQITGAIEEAALLGRPSGSLADRDTVGTSQIDANAVTSADSTTTSYSVSGSTDSEWEIGRHTPTIPLTSGSKALIDVRVAGTSAGLQPSLTYTITTGTRDIWVRLIRDPDGAADEVDARLFRANAPNGGPTSQPYFPFGFVAEDSAHGGGTITYAVVVTTYTAGTTTPNAVLMAIDDIDTLIYSLEAIR
jgi:hypothetical protein